MEAPVLRGGEEGTDGDPPPFGAGDSELVTRRSALGIGAGAAATLALGGLPARARVTASPYLPYRLRPDQLPHPDRPMGEPGIPRIEHVVLLMMENHSTDNVLGMLPHVSAARRDFDGLPVDRNGIPIASNPDNTGRHARSFALPDVCPAHGLTQNWNSSHHQWDSGRNDGFVRNANSHTPMGYLTSAQMPVTYALASHFPVSDRFFCSVLGQTLPNRRYYFSGTSSGQINDDNSSILVSAHNGTIFDRLDAGRVSWRVYYGNTPSPFYFPQFPEQPAPGSPVRKERSVLLRRRWRAAPVDLVPRGEFRLPIRGEPAGHRVWRELSQASRDSRDGQPSVAQDRLVHHLRRARRLV